MQACLISSACALNPALERCCAQACRSGAGLPELKRQLDAMVADYGLKTSGPTRWEKLAAFLQVGGQLLQPGHTCAPPLPLTHPSCNIYCVCPPPRSPLPLHHAPYIEPPPLPPSFPLLCVGL